MAEALGVAGSIIAIVQISTSAYLACQKYMLGAKYARENIQSLCNEISAIHDVLDSIAESSIGQAAHGSALNNLQKEGSTAQQCQDVLTEIEIQLQTDISRAPMKKYGLRALTWPFKKEKVDVWVKDLERHKKTFILALGIDQRKLIQQIDTKVSPLREFHFSEADKRLRESILKWLYECDPSEDHRKNRSKHQPETGKWFTEGPIMKEWCENPNSVVWLHGKAGCGKSILASTIIEHVKDHKTSGFDSACAYFYFTFTDERKRKASNFLSTILAQLISEKTELPERAKNLWRLCKDGHEKPTIDRLKATIFGIVPLLTGHIYVVVDALDECPEEDQERKLLFKIFSEIQAQNQSNVHILLTSRNPPSIERVLQPLLTTSALCIETSQLHFDIKIYIESELSLLNSKMWTIELKEEAQNALLSGANGMFRWVACQLPNLKKCLKPKQVRETLKSLPKTLEETYARMLEAIDDIYRENAITALKWLVYAMRPLSVPELAESIIITLGEDLALDLDERLSDPRDILQILSGLVTVAPDPYSRYGLYDSGADIFKEKEHHGDVVTLAYFSVREFLRSAYLKHSANASFFMEDPTADPSAEIFVLESCFTYMVHLFRVKSQLSWVKVEFEEVCVVHDFPLSRYIFYWQSHRDRLLQLDFKLRPSAVSTILQLIDLMMLRHPKQMEWLWRRTSPEYWRNSDAVYRYIEGASDSKPWTMYVVDGVNLLPFYVACKLGLPDVACSFLDKGYDVNMVLEGIYVDRKRFFLDICPLQTAAQENTVSVAQLLLDRGAHPDGSDHLAVSPLSLAAANGHDSMITLLLEKGADINLRAGSADGWVFPRNHCISHGKDWTALMNALRHDRTSVVELLLKRGADERIIPAGVGSVLHFALKNMVEDHSVELLLNRVWNERDRTSMARVRNALGRTVLHVATAYWDTSSAVMMKLLDWGAEVDAEDFEARTPLFYALKSRRYDRIALLLSRRASLLRIDRESLKGFWSEVRERGEWNTECRQTAILLEEALRKHGGFDDILSGEFFAPKFDVIL